MEILSTLQVPTRHFKCCGNHHALALGGILSTLTFLAIPACDADIYSLTALVLPSHAAHNPEVHNYQVASPCERGP